MKSFAFKFVLLLFIAGIASLNLPAQGMSYPSEITVGKDGSANYKTIQEAINSIRDLGDKEIRIYIKKGVYNEKLRIPSWKTNILLIGESKEGTIITYSDYSGKSNPVGKDAFGNEKFSTYTSYTMLIEANDIVLENLTVINSSGRVGQAVALHVEGDRFIARNCSFLGNQDTLFAATENSRQYYINCYVEGTTDFIFGKATAVFQECVIRSLADSYITAAATTARQKFGFVFLSCRFIADSSLKKVYLGRPWRPYAKTVILNSSLGNHILPEGWNSWKGDDMFRNKEKTAYYAEYRNSGQGSATNNRIYWSKQLTRAESNNYTVYNILGGGDNWNPLMK